MTIEEAIKDIQEDGIDLGAGDYVDVEALKIAVEVMKDYQRVVYENEQLRQKQKGQRNENIDQLQVLEILSRIILEALSEEL